MFAPPGNKKAKPGAAKTSGRAVEFREPDFTG
jgi:hypothetical protein